MRAAGVKKGPFEQGTLMIFLVGCAGIEPAANGLKVRCSTAELTARVAFLLEHRLLTARIKVVKKKLDIFQS